MFGSQPRVRPPVLLILVFGVLLILVGITATTQTVMVSAYASQSTLTSVVEGDVATIRGFVHDGLDGLDLDEPNAATRERLSGYLSTLLAKGGLVHAEIRAADGRLIAQSVVGAGGSSEDTPPGTDFDAAAAGRPAIGIVARSASGAPASVEAETLIREYLPLQQEGVTLLVIGVWRDAAPVLTQLEALRRDVVIVTVSAALVAAVVLYVVFRSAHRTIGRQTEALVEATRLDALTSTLNHGALVAHLAAEIERTRPTGGVLGVALIDVDNFRLLNDTHGHRAGDDVLLMVSDAIGVELPTGAVMGRYGPDEFLVVADGISTEAMLPTVQRLRGALTSESLQFEATEQLPVTVSAGIAMFPEHGMSVTELLTTVATTLHEARASGGDAIRVAGSDAAQRRPASNFDVLQGLVFAVDTKDRYTKRHSEDVARYGVFLAKRLGLEPSVIDTVRLAGLLHDVGKIGIPDAILRKPGRLTAEEYAIVKQHVALGDMIVRDLPNIDAVRAGVRHHHERWDGNGYLEALRGADIPLIGRILAVGDAFSAMTTTRPYRKALDVREALRRLGDAAGTQLDEALVTAFIEGIENDAAAPLPGAHPQATFAWSLEQRVA
jgi:diguanylate cyclase (GGDEF)-like protein